MPQGLFGIGGEARGGEGTARAEVTLAPEWQHDNVKVAFVQERGTVHVIRAAAVPLLSARR